MEWQSKIYFSFPHNVNFIRYGSSSLQYPKHEDEVMLFSALQDVFHQLTEGT